MKLTIDVPEARDEYDVAEELRRIAKMIENDFTSGEVRGHGWWDMSGEWAEPEDEQ